MPDYLYIPKCVQSIYTEGAVLYDKYVSSGGTKLNYKIGYQTTDSYGIKIGCFKNSSEETVWVVGCTSRVTHISIRLVSSSDVSLFEISSIVQQYERGYYATKVYNVLPLAGSIYVEVYSSLQDVLDAFGGAVPPGPMDGVVVVATAYPVTTPPTSNGVSVYAIAKLADPNTQGGTSTTGGGQGTFDDSSDPNPIPSLPTLSAAQSGLVTLFKPTSAEIVDLSNYLWTNLTDFIENLNKLFANPMDYLISLNIFPCNPEVGTKRTINIGSFTTSIVMAPILSQWYEHDCGSVKINEYWGSALDYSPNTKVSLFLPFIGSVQLNTDEVMNHLIGVKYRIDLLSGQCVAIVTVDDEMYYQFTGACSVSLPLTGSDWSRIYSAAIGAVGTAVSGAVGAAAGSLVTSGSGVASSVNAAANAGSAYAAILNAHAGSRAASSMKQNMAEAASLALANAQNAAAENPGHSAGITASRITNTISNTVSQVVAGKASVQHSGSVTGSAGILGARTPFLIIEYPNQSLADDYKHFVGYPSNMYAVLGSLNGYTEVEKVIISIPGTDGELAELVESLKGGVYL